jgi:hypothetical protein
VDDTDVLGGVDVEETALEADALGVDELCCLVVSDVDES